MAALTNQAIAYESAQSANAFALMTTTDRTTYSTTVKPWSQAPGVEYTVGPYGLMTGGEVTPGVAVNSVRMATLTAMMPGATGADATTGVRTVAEKVDDLLTVTRGDTAGAYIINSLTIDSTGAPAMVASQKSTAGFIATRGSAGGPPTIPVGSFEVAQVKLTTTASAVVAASEIFQVVGDSQERYDFPVWSEDPIRGQITFSAALPLAHGSVATAGATASKAVYVKAATPVFAEVSRARDWVPAETSYSVTSEAYYDGAVGSSSPTLGGASFNCALNDGITDAMLAKRGQSLLFRFKADKNKAPYQYTQGILGVARTFGVGASATAAITIAAAQETVDFAS